MLSRRPISYVKGINMRDASTGRDFRRRGYHHGNLKEALKAAARQLIIEKGPYGFSLVEAARFAKVSPAAPYRHYKDRNALLMEIGQQGFDIFARRLQEAWANGTPDPVSALLRVVEAYVEFAQQEKAYYATMFSTTYPGGVDEEFCRSGDRAFRLLKEMIAELPLEFSSESSESVEEISIHIWALSHGTATLFAQNSSKNNIDPLDVLIRAVCVYLKGLGLHAKLD